MIRDPFKFKVLQVTVSAPIILNRNMKLEKTVRIESRRYPDSESDSALTRRPTVQVKQ